MDVPDRIFRRRLGFGVRYLAEMMHSESVGWEAAGRGGDRWCSRRFGC